MTQEHSPSNPPDVLRELSERLRADGGRYLLSVGMTAEEIAHTPAPTFGGKATRRWLSDEEYAALCSLLAPSETTAAPKRAYYETHEPPHCPTCDYGQSATFEQLRRIDQAARAFVNALPGSMTFRGAQGAFNAMCDALFDGRPAPKADCEHEYPTVTGPETPCIKCGKPYF
jgi:hypothetical protein